MFMVFPKFRLNAVEDAEKEFVATVGIVTDRRLVDECVLLGEFLVCCLAFWFVDEACYEEACSPGGRC